MNTNEAPEKLYLLPNGFISYFRNTDEDIEYTRTNTFIEKACEIFCKMRCNDKPPRSTCTSLGTCGEHDEFRKALKGK